jgi:hypothetical protein
MKQALRLLRYTPETNIQLAEWTERDEPNPKRGKTQRSAGKVMASVWRVALYSSITSKRAMSSTVSKTAPFEEEKLLFHQDNAPVHKSIKIA